MDIKKEQRHAPTFVNLKSNTMKNTVQRYGFFPNPQIHHPFFATFTCYLTSIYRFK